MGCFASFFVCLFLIIFFSILLQGEACLQHQDRGSSGRQNYRYKWGKGCCVGWCPQRSRLWPLTSFFFSSLVFVFVATQWLFSTITNVKCLCWKIWNRLDCQHSEKSSKTHKRLNERFLIRQNMTKRANFRCNHLFQATYNTTVNS